MKKGNSAYKMLTTLTLVFVLIAAYSFKAFQTTESDCIGEIEQCTQQLKPAQKGGEMLWDGFSRRFVSLIILK